MVVESLDRSALLFCRQSSLVVEVEHRMDQDTTEQKIQKKEKAVNSRIEGQKWINEGSGYGEE